MERCILMLLASAAAAWVCWAQPPGGAPASLSATTRPAAVAGSWYPADPAELAKLMQRYLAEAKPPPLPGEAAALVVPHAGYAYSGPTAALAYKTVEGKAFSRVILLGPSHQAYFAGAVVPNVTHFATPLGDVALDTEACRKLAAAAGFAADDRPHAREHCLEIQLPLLRTAVKDLRIVPVLVGAVDAKTISQLAAGIRGLLDERTLVVVSSDFTHYGPNFGYTPALGGKVEAGLAQLDGGAIDRILACDGRGFADFVQATGATICGHWPIAIALEALEDRPDLEGLRLGYTTSGQITKDWTNSVSYAAIALCRGAASPLDHQEQKSLLRLARDQVRRFLREGKKLEDAEKTYGLSPRLTKPGAAFVTLTRGGQLRGCIGHLAPVMPLYQSVMENAISACQDPRFTGDPVTAAEEPRLEIELSILSRYRQIASVDQIKVGRDGLIIRRGRAGGLLLPQVPVQQKWDLNQYLVGLCRKAGLPPDAWKDPDTRIYRFTAQVFGEGHVGTAPASGPASRPGAAPAGGAGQAG